MIVLYCFLILKVFMRITLGYFLKTFLLISKKMGCCFPSSRNKPSIEVIDVIDLSKHFVYLRPSGKLVYKVDDIYNLLRVDIYFDGWYPNSVCLWPKDNSARQHYLTIEGLHQHVHSFPLLRHMKVMLNVTLTQFIIFFILSKKKDG